MTVQYTDEAIGEVSDILGYIASKNPDVSHEVSTAIEATVDLLRRQPMIARIVYQGQVRAYHVEKYPYGIVYQIKPDEIVIRNVRHTGRRRPWEGE